MEMVKVLESSHQWEAMYKKMAQGIPANINEIPFLEPPVSNNPTWTTDREGYQTAPKEGANIHPPKEHSQEPDKIYQQAASVGELPLSKSASKKRKKSSSHKSSSKKVKKSSSDSRKKGPAPKRQRKSLTKR